MAQQPFDLARLMRQHRVTIRDLAGRMNVTQKAIREVRAQTHVSYLTLCDFYQAVTGKNIFDRTFFDSIN